MGFSIELETNAFIWTFKIIKYNLKKRLFFRSVTSMLGQKTWTLIQHYKLNPLNTYKIEIIAVNYKFFNVLNLLSKLFSEFLYVCYIIKFSLFGVGV